MTRRSIALGAALLFLNASITFENVWPTPAIAWRGKLSLELALSVLVMALAARGRLVAARGESPASHRGRRGAPLTRRDDREYRESLLSKLDRIQG